MAGHYNGDYWADHAFPPEYERKAGVDYATLGRQFNLGNPFD